MIPALVCQTNADEGAKVVVPALDKVVEIYFTFDSGWNLIIRSDGSGKLRYGSSPLAVGAFPAGTFTFEELYNQIIGRLKARRVLRNDVAVALSKEGDVSVSANYIDDIPFMKSVFAVGAEHAVAWDSKTFKKLLTDYPPFAPDEPKP